MTWTKQPPKERGCYWHRGEDGLSIVRGPDRLGLWMVMGDERMAYKATLMSQPGEWWDQRIPEPPAESPSDKPVGCTCNATCAADCKGTCGCEACRMAYGDFLSME